MSDDLLTVVNRRTAISAVRAEAARAGLDAEALLDSKTLYDRVTALDPDEVAFPRRVSEIVQGHATARGLTPAGSPRAAAPATAPAARSGGDAGHNGTPGGNRQWTEADVAALPKTREGSRQLQDAIEAGLLTDLGYGGRRRGRRR